ncbi:MAG: PcfJ domain-containing protein [Lewinellaceae bacterium]|nr:PcfJ domain-containing protein [Lewinellaceae bacterium]
MANRLKRVQQAEKKRLENALIIEKFRLTETRVSTPRVRKRRPERAEKLAELKGVFDFCWNRKRIGKSIGPYHPEALEKLLLGSRSLLLMMIQDTNWLVKLLLLFEHVPVVRSLDTWKAPKSRRGDRLFASFVFHTFIRYEFPKPLMEALLYELPDAGLVEATQHFAQGRNFRQFSGASIPFTRKMAHFALHAPTSVDWEDVGPWALLRSLGFSQSQTDFLLNACQIDNDSVVALLPLWHFIGRHPEVPNREIQHFILFIQEQAQQQVTVYHPVYASAATIKPLYPNFSIQGATLESIRRRVKIWEDLKKEVSNAINIKAFPTSSVRGWEKGGLLIQQLLFVQDLVREGRAMGHCVATYRSDCLQGRCSIWSLQSDGQRVATIELSSKLEVMQVKGKFNRYPGDDVMKVVENWVRREKLHLRTV